MISENNSESVIEWSSVQKLLNLAQSCCERECHNFAIFKGTGMSANQAHKCYGFEKMIERCAANV